MHRSAALLFVAAASLFTTAALAVPRAYVASYGNDANTATNCGPTTPCRTFATAMTVADAGGQVIVLDSAGYGSVVITKSISIIAPDGIYAGLTVASGGTAVEIATPGVDVVLKGLTITGQGDGNGIDMTAGNSLHVEKTTIANFAPGGSGAGLRVQTGARVKVVDSVLRGNGYGIYAGNGAAVSVLGTRILDNGSVGIGVNSFGTASGTSTAIEISESAIAGSAWCVINYEAAGNTASINAARSTVTNCVYGLHNDSGGTNTTVIGGSTVSNNSYGLYRSGGTLVSMGNNTVYGNTTNTVGTISVAALQ
jgi:hypothetical protein